MLRAVSRLSREEFPKGSSPTTHRGDLLTIRAYKGTLTKVSVVISKKTLSMAHERHVIKRRIYSLFKDILHTIPKGSYVVFPNKGILKAKQKQIKAEIDSMVSKSINRHHA